MELPVTLTGRLPSPRPELELEWLLASIGKRPGHARLPVILTRRESPGQMSSLSYSKSNVYGPTVYREWLQLEPEITSSNHCKTPSRGCQWAQLGRESRQVVVTGTNRLTPGRIAGPLPTSNLNSKLELRPWLGLAGSWTRLTTHDWLSAWQPEPLGPQAEILQGAAARIAGRQAGPWPSVSLSASGRTVIWKVGMCFTTN